MSATDRIVLPVMTGKSKKLAKSSPDSSRFIPAGETSFVAELATVTDHTDIDYQMRGTPQSTDVVDLDVIMVDAPDIEVELGVPELDSTEVSLTFEDLDTVMENAPLAELEVKLHVSELHAEDIIIDYS